MIPKTEPAAPLAVGLKSAAGMLSVAPRTLRKMASDGRCPSCKIGRRLVFRVTDLERLLARAVRNFEPELRVVGGRN